MKKRLQHTLFPLVALILLAGIALLIMLYARYNADLKVISDRSHVEFRILQHLEQLERTERAGVQSVQRYLYSGEPKYLNDFAVAEKKCSLHRAALQLAPGQRQLDQTALTRIDSLFARRQSNIKAAIELRNKVGNPGAIAFWMDPARLLTATQVAQTLQQTKTSCFNRINAGRLSLFAKQREVEQVRLFTLLLLTAALLVFFGLVYRHLRVSFVLQRREAYNTALLNHIRDGVAITDKRKHLLRYNPAMAQLLPGIAGKQGNNLCGLIPGLNAEVQHLMDTALDRDGVWYHETDEHNANNPGLVWSIQVSRLYDEQHADIGLLWTIEDITRQKMQLAELTTHAGKLEFRVGQQLQLLEKAWNEAPEGILQLDRDGRLRFINQTGASFFSAPVKTVLGKSLYDLFPELKGSFAQRAFRQATATETEQHVEFRMSRTGRVYQATIIPGGDATTVVFRDVSQLKEAHRTMASLSGALQEARDEERRRISRELHDDLGQQLTSNKILLCYLSDTAAQHDAELTKQFGLLERQMQKAIDTVRHLSRGFHPAQVEDLGLWDAMRQDAAAFTRHTQTQLVLGEELEALELEKKTAVQLYHIFAEAMSNINRHARATQVTISGLVNEEQLTLQVRDNGKGFDLSARAGHKTGIAAMQERASLLRGWLTIESACGSGTCVTVNIPLDAQGSKVVS